MPKEIGFANLPKDILDTIFSFFKKPSDIGNLAIVCKSTNRIWETKVKELTECPLSEGETYQSFYLQAYENFLAPLAELQDVNDRLEFGPYQNWWPLNVAIYLGYEKQVLRLLKQTDYPQNFKNFIKKSHCKLPLTLALRSPNAKIFPMLIAYLEEKNILEDIWQIHQNNNHLFYLAAAAGNASAITLLLKKLPHKAMEMDLTKKFSKALPIHAACMSGDLETIQLVAKSSNAESNRKHTKYRDLPPLSVACQCLHPNNKEGPAIVEFLIKQYPDSLNYVSNNDSSEPATALQLAAQNGNLAIIKVLLEAGADKNLANQHGAFPFCFAAQYHHFKAFELLIDFEEENVETLIKENYSILNFVPFGNEDTTLLHLAVKNCKDDEGVDLIKFLLKNGADPKALDGKKKVPLHYLEQNAKTTEILQLLIDHGGDVTEHEGNLKNLWKTIDPFSHHHPLFQIAGNFQTLQLIKTKLDKEFCSELVTYNGNSTLLHLATSYKGDDLEDGFNLLLEIVRPKMLLQRSESNRIPLEEACYNQNWRAFLALYEKTLAALDPLSEDALNKLYSSMFELCTSRHLTDEGLAIVTLLLKRGTKVDISNGLFNAFLHGELQAITKLLEDSDVGADVQKAIKDELLRFLSVTVKFHQFEKDERNKSSTTFYPAAEMLDLLLKLGAAQYIETPCGIFNKKPIDEAHAYLKPKLARAIAQFKKEQTKQDEQSLFQDARSFQPGG